MTSRTTPLAIFPLLVLASGPVQAGSAEEAALASITEAELRRHVATLASDEYEGRKPSTPGEAKTLSYLVDRYAELGLEPAGGGSYLQPVRLLSQRSKESSRLDVIGSEGRRLRWRLGDDLYLDLAAEGRDLRLSERGVVFAGHGIVAPERGWNDYAGLDVEGKVVLLLKKEPGREDDEGFFDGLVPTYYSTLDYKKNEAGRQGAVAVLFVHQGRVSGFPWSKVGEQALGERWSVPRGATARPGVMLSGAVREDAVREAFTLAGVNFDELAARAGEDGFRGTELDLRIKGRVQVQRSESPSANVIGLIRGSERPDQYLIYTAHWDHVGIGEPVDGDAIYNGAVDNATGTAALLEIAEAFASLPEPPARSVVFIATTGEEMGLLGSRFYVNHPTLPLEETMGVINMDALFPFGPQNGMTVTGRGQSELEHYLDRAVRAEGRVPQADPSPQAGAFFRSDHHPFARAGVPALFAVGGPLPEPAPSEELIAKYQDFMSRRYHRPDDELHEGWDFRGILQDARIFFRTGLAIASDRRVPNWSLGSEYRALRDQMLSGHD